MRINLYTILSIGIAAMIVIGLGIFAIPFVRGMAGASGFLLANPTPTHVPTAVVTPTSVPSATPRPAATARPVIDADLRTGPGSAYDLVAPAAARRPLLLVGCNEDCSWFMTDTGVWVAGVLLDRPPARLPVVTPDAALAAKASALVPTLTSTPLALAQLLPTPTPPAADAATAPNAVVVENANLRAGPGTDYALAGRAEAGQPVTLRARTADSSWYQLDGNLWIAAFLVADAPAELPVATEMTAQP